jgi:hypothetical protein
VTAGNQRQQHLQHLQAGFVLLLLLPQEDDVAAT